MARDSEIAALKKVVSSKPLQVVFGIVCTVIGGGYSWIKGWDQGLTSAGADLQALTSKVAAIEGKLSATENALGETSAQLIAAEERVAAMAAREQQRSQAAVIEAAADEKAEYEYWRAIVMSNAPKNRSDAYARSYKSNYEDGLRPMTAAHMTLGWGSVER